MLERSTVHRKLDAKFKIGGMEATDLLAVLILAAVLNLIFGRISIGPIFVFGLPSILFCAVTMTSSRITLPSRFIVVLSGLDRHSWWDNLSQRNVRILA